MSNPVEPTTEARVRERAYHLWEQAGCPDGRSEEFWHQAAAEIGANETEIKPEEFGPGTDAPSGPAI